MSEMKRNCLIGSGGSGCALKKGRLQSRSGGGSPLIRAPNRPNSPRGACPGWFGPWLGPERPRGRPVLGPENAATVRGAPFPEEVLSL